LDKELGGSENLVSAAVDGRDEIADSIRAFLGRGC